MNNFLSNVLNRMGAGMLTTFLKYSGLEIIVEDGKIKDVIHSESV